MNEKERDYSDVKKEDFDPYDGPVFTFVPGPYYLAMWCQPISQKVCPPGAWGGNITALVLRRPEETINWRMKYRMRYYFEQTPFGEEDQRSWYTGTIKNQTEEQVIAHMEQFFRVMCEIAGSKFDQMGYFEIKGDSELAMDKLLKSPPEWLHIKKEVRQNEKVL